MSNLIAKLVEDSGKTKVDLIGDDIVSRQSKNSGALRNKVLGVLAKYYSLPKENFKGKLGIVAVTGGIRITCDLANVTFTEATCQALVGALLLCGNVAQSAETETEVSAVPTTLASYDLLDPAGDLAGNIVERLKKLAKTDMQKLATFGAAGLFSTFAEHVEAVLSGPLNLDAKLDAQIASRDKLAKLASDYTTAAANLASIQDMVATTTATALKTALQGAEAAAEEEDEIAGTALHSAATAYIATYGEQYGAKQKAISKALDSAGFVYTTPEDEPKTGKPEEPGK